jgi:hypothetical protein
MNEAVQAIAGIPPRGPKDQTPVDTALAIYLNRIDKMQTEVKKIGVEARLVQEEIKQLHQLMDALKGTMDSKGTIDLSQNPDLQKQLKEVQNKYGMNAQDKVKFDTFERERLMESLSYHSSELDREHLTKTKEIEALRSKSEQFILIVKEMSSTWNRATSSIIHNMK